MKIEKLRSEKDIYREKLNHIQTVSLHWILLSFVSSCFGNNRWRKKYGEEKYGSQ